MSKRAVWGTCLGLALALTAGIASVWFGTGVRAAGGPFPAPTQDEVRAPGQETIVLSGGCFWGMELVYEHVRGVISATPGYAGGDANSADYDDVSTGETGHAESVQLVYNPAQVTLGDLLKVFFSVAHDPTELDYQGPDHGTQYRSAIWTTGEAQAQIARAYVAQLDHAHVFARTIVTQIKPLPKFYPAESYHLHYADRHPTNLYIVINDRPKLSALRAQWPQLSH